MSVFQFVSIASSGSGTTDKSLALSSLHAPLRYILMKSPEPLLLQAEQSQLSWPLLLGDVLQSLYQFDGSTFDSSQYIHACLVLGGTELDTVLHVQSHQCWVEGEDDFP